MISREGEQALRNELAALLDERSNELPRRLQLAREFGEPANNDEYLQIIEEEAIKSARIRNLSATLASAQVVDPALGKHDVAELGSIVTLRISGKRVELQVLGAHEPIGAGGVSVASPVGQAILGRGAGEAVKAKLPGGNTVDLEIIAVRAPDRRSGVSV